jgi:hypothetical protein
VSREYVYRLTELSPEFLHISDHNSYWRDCPDNKEYPVDLSNADGICFKCPKCFKENGGPKGTHMVICWQPHVPQDIPPIPGRWKFSGNGYNDLTLTAQSSSIAITSGCAAHFFVTGGEVTAA